MCYSPQTVLIIVNPLSLYKKIEFVFQYLQNDFLGFLLNLQVRLGRTDIYMLLRPFACETGLSLYMFFDFFHQSSSFPHTYLVHFACGFIYAWVFLFQMIIRMLQVFFFTLLILPPPYTISRRVYTPVQVGLCN